MHCLTLLQTVQVEKPELSWACRVWQHLKVSLSPRLARCRQTAAAPADHPRTPHLALKGLTWREKKWGKSCIGHTKKSGDEINNGLNRKDGADLRGRKSTRSEWRGR
jgi:hypothetical protein